MPDAAAYLAQLQALMPHGLAWSREAEARLASLLGATADELARVDARAADLIAESDPRRSSELLEAWERITGLPDACVTDLGTVQARRDAVAARLGQLGDQSRAYFIALAAAVGFPVTITEFRPFVVGAGGAGDDLTDDAWAHAWRVNAPAETVRYFAVGESVAGEGLAAWGNGLLECTVSRVAPAHTKVIFGYADPVAPEAPGGSRAWENIDTPWENIDIPWEAL